MKDEHSSIGKIVFLFVCTLPYKFFCILYFVGTLPRRLRQIKRYKEAPKLICIRRLSDKPVTALEAFDLVRSLRMAEGQEDFSTKQPSLFDLLEALWSEGMSPDWKMPSVSELEAVQDKVTLEIDSGVLTGTPRHAFFIWALDEHLHMFVAYSPFTKKVKTGALPEHISRSVLRGKAPDSRGTSYAYAVRVSIKEP